MSARPAGGRPVLLMVGAAPVLALCACASGAQRPASGDVRPVGGVEAALGAARYMVPTDSSAWVERTQDGLDRIVVNGCRIEARGAEIARTAPPEPELDGGFAMPPWTATTAATPAGAGAATPRAAIRYVFWRGKDLYSAPSFMGELTKIATLRADVTRAFEWTDGVGLLTSDGAAVVRAATALPEPLGIPGVVDAIAADARRAVALTTFGRAWITLDGGVSIRDASGDLGEAIKLEVQGDAIVALFSGDRRRFITPEGAVVDSIPAIGPKRGARPPDRDDRWPSAVQSDPLEALASTGIFLADGSVAAAARGVAGHIDAASGRAIAATEIPADDGACAPIRVADELLLVCEGKERSAVIDLIGSPRVERTFDLFGAADYDRFSGVDGEALGFLGPCDGTPPRATDLDVITSASPYNASSQRSAVFCARRSRDVWIEHRLEPADANDAIAWIPRSGGAATAIVARPGTFLDDAERVTVRGPLRVVRVARGEPPLAIPQHGVRSPAVLSRALRASPDGTVEGWLPTTSYPSSTSSVEIDPRGRVRIRSLPSRASVLVSSGAFAVAQTDDGRLYETIDWGRRWLGVEPPPGNPLARPWSCSPAGCRIGPFIRVGWSSANPSAKPKAAEAGDNPVEPDASALRALRERQYRRSLPPLPIVRLRCGFASPAEGARIADSYGFGVTPSPVPRTTPPAKLASIGTLMLPSNGAQVLQSGDAELAWLPPLNEEAPIRRVTMSLSRAGVSLRHRPYDVRLGCVIGAEGRVEPIAVGTPDACLAGLLDAAGVTRPSGGCAPDPTVGVDLGDRTLLLSSRYGSHTLLAVDTPGTRSLATRGEAALRPRAGGRGARGDGPAGAPSSILLTQRELYRTPVAQGAHSYTFGVGARRGAPVAVAFDGRGDAVLTPIDPDHGTFGAEERLAPLTALALGNDHACAQSSDQARVVISFDSEIGLDREAMPGVAAAGTGGLAVIRWSAFKVCLDAIELNVRDERHEVDVGWYDPPGTVRKLVARFVSTAGRTKTTKVRPSGVAAAERGSSPPAIAGRPTAKGAANGRLALVMYGAELRQRVLCTGIAP